MLKISKIIAALLLLLSSVSAFGGSSTGGEGFIGYNSSLDLNFKDSPNEEEDDVSTSNTYLGLNVYYSSKHFVLNSLIKLDSADAEEAWIESFSISKNLNVKGVDMGFTVGNIIIPFGLFEVQRVIPTVITPITLNSNTFSEVFADRVIQPTNNGFLYRFDAGNITTTIGYYEPYDNVIYYNKTESRRVRIEQDSIEILGREFEFPILVIDLRGIQSREGETIFADATITAIHSINIEKTSGFFGLTYDNRDNLIIDFEYINSTSKEVNDEGTLSEFSIKDSEEYFYIGTQYTMTKRLSIILEANTFVTASGKEYRDDIGFSSYSAGFTYDLNRFLIMGNANTVTGDLLDISEFSIGAVARVYENLYVRALYKEVEGYITDINYSSRSVYCQPFDVDCQTIGAFFTNEDNELEVEYIEREFGNSGFDLRAIWYF